jgi:hypothetical protein
MFGTSGIQFDRDTNINFTFDSSGGGYKSSLWVAQADSGNTGYSSIARLFYESKPSAHYCYSRWGAKAKVEDLESRYPQFISKASAEKRRGLHTITRKTSTTESKAEVLDLATVIKASQAIGSEIVLEQLLQKLMKIIIEMLEHKSDILLGKITINYSLKLRD